VVADDQHPPRGLSDRLLAVVAIALTLFQIWQGISAELSAPSFLTIHLGWVLLLIFLYRPTFPARSGRGLYLAGRILDGCMIVATLWASQVIATFDYDDLSFLFDGLSGGQMTAGILLLSLLLEATRRTVGWVMSAIALTFLAYALFGNLLPSAIASRGFGLEEVIRFHVYSSNGVYGSPLAIAAGVVFVFVLFGAFLSATGAGRFFIDCAFAVAGRSRGGPAKAAVLASAAMGSISGSAIANTVTTGALTIPMMKRIGYTPAQAAGIEAAASTGGQIMPPVMGAGAFVMAQFTGIPYADILLVSIVPAILYFLCTLLYVHLMACKLNLQGMAPEHRMKALLAAGWHYLLPLMLITVLLVMSYPPLLVGLAGSLAIVVVGALRRSTRVGFTVLLAAFRDGALMILPISAACATAGIVVGVVGQTGIGLLFTQSLLSLSGGYLLGMFALVALAGLVLGMGLPVTAAYIVLAVLAVPALMEFGLSLLVAHLIVFWLSQASNVTPPIALAAFAGAGVAGAQPMAAAVQAFKLAFGLFIIPLMMAEADLIWYQGVSFGEFTLAVTATLGLIVAFACGVEGRMFRPLAKEVRVLLLLIAMALVLNEELLRLPGLLGLLAVIGWDWWASRRGVGAGSSREDS